MREMDLKAHPRPIVGVECLKLKTCSKQGHNGKGVADYLRWVWAFVSVHSENRKGKTGMIRRSDTQGGNHLHCDPLGANHLSGLNLTNLSLNFQTLVQRTYRVRNQVRCP
jgi:hypothetical protein